LRPGDDFALVADDRRVVAVTDSGAGQRSLLTIDRDGGVGVRAAEIGYGGVAYCGGRLVTQRWDTAEDPVIDLQSGDEVFKVPHVEPALGRDWVLFTTAGCLVRHGDRLEFYHPNDRARRWMREIPIGPGRPSPLVASHDGRRLALGHGDSTDLFLILSAETGETISRIVRPMAGGRFRGGYALSAGFSRDGTDLLIAFDGELRVHDAASGELQRAVALERSEAVWAARDLEQGWLLGADDRSLFFDAERGRGAVIPLSRIDQVFPLRTGAGAALLTETSVGRGAIVTPDGTVLRSWVLDVASSVRKADAPPLSGVAFGGRLIARLTGTSAVELIDAATLRAAATVHVLKLGDGFGWVVHTPDGYWDAGPGADHYVAVYRDGRPAEAPSRRVESLLGRRLNP
jgi:hypothetical protein